jgi:hypothetical protein
VSSAGERVRVTGGDRVAPDIENAGLGALLEQPLLETMWHRRTHRVSRGASVLAGSMTYASTNEPAPLSELEEALLIAITGSSGLTMPDRPFQDPRNGQPIMAKPNLAVMSGRTAGSPDNAQGTHFFMINDTGTYFLRKLPPPLEGAPFDAATLVERARRSKVKVLDRRLDVPEGMRDFPAYLDSNRFLSNLPGTTLFLPVVDVSHQYINAIMYLLTQPDGARPAFVDDRNFYLPAGVRKWIRNGFLNDDIKVPIGALGPMRTQIEADLLVQNMMLAADGMGLGAWIHASINPAIMLGDPRFAPRYGRMLGFDFATPRFRLADIVRWHVPLPRFTNLRTQPIGLTVRGEPLIAAACPPNYESMSHAVDEIIKRKFEPGGIYEDRALFSTIYKGDFGDRYLAEAGEYDPRVIDCARDICEYVYSTHGRFPAHTDAIHVPGIWLQVHHPEIEYYDRFFRHGLASTHREHDQNWHRQPSGRD